MAGDDWRRLSEAVRARMRELGIADQADLIRATKLSPPTIKGIVDGVPRSGNARAKTYQQLDDGLSWERGSTAAVLAGGAPVAHDVKRGGPPAVSRSDEGELRAELRDLRTLVERVLDRLDLVDKRVDGLTTILEATEEQVSVLFEARESYAAGISTLPDQAPSSVRPLRPKSQPTSPPKQ
jgi:hypothetical protein